ncbi:hypothetical protein BBJ28_00018543 [Nothophytophthora sp. Chile5]|nr:hypothetical protein BBJ28_00018543 [Nothophytophthora sp. Chile5]
MSGNAGDSTSQATEDDAVFHVRLIHCWPPPETSPPQEEALLSSFFGLQLELRGSTTSLPSQTESTTPASQVTTAPLLFQSNGAASINQHLEAIKAPFEVVVVGKLPPSSSSVDEQATLVMQQIASVQTDNVLLEINGQRISLDDGAPGGLDVARRLGLLASQASLASPFELTFRRHNHSQAVAKIVPFARRQDVQNAQVAQQAKLAKQEAALPVDVRHKKLFLLQQLDFEREHYLVAYVAAELQDLQSRVMSGGQWQAFEFAKTLWYFHVPTARLYAEHPLRNHREARELLTRVQQQIQQAVRRLQRRTRGYQRRKRFLAVLKVERERREELRRLEEQRRAEEQRLEAERQERQRQEQQKLEIQRQEERRREEYKQQQQELVELRLELKQLKKSKAATTSETQTSDRKVSVDQQEAIDALKREVQRLEEQQREQQERLRLELQRLKQTKAAVECDTQTSSRRWPDEGAEAVESLRKEELRNRVDELELQLKQRPQKIEKVVTECDTQTSSRHGVEVQDQAIDTQMELEWKRYLTLLRVTVKKKKSKAKTSPKHRSVQTEKLSAASNTSSLCSLKSPTAQFDGLEVTLPPIRSLESFFALDLTPPPALVEHPWRQESTSLPVRITQRIVTPVLHQQQQRSERDEPIRAKNGTESSSPIDKNATAFSPTRLPYITRRRRKPTASLP